MSFPLLPLSTDCPESVQQILIRDWDKLQASDTYFNQLDGETCEQIFRVWGSSEFATQFCIRHSGEFAAMLQQQRLQNAATIDELESIVRQAFIEVSDENELMRALRMVRQRETVRCVWREVLGLATVEETLHSVTIIAETLVDVALLWLYDQACDKPSGAPTQTENARAGGMAVLGMGKLGGRELNFSSDIDLIFFFPESGETTGERPITHEQFFSRLGKSLIRVLDSVTGEGFVYRVDMRLRPFGESGPLVVSMASMENYYVVHGREWERYALIKARTIAGDYDEGEQLLQMLQGFMYRRYLDYGAIESLRDMKIMISREAARRYSGDHVKLGPGGIREVEFIAQLFQLIHGGRDRNLRSSSLKTVLDYLPERGLIPQEAVDELYGAYCYLRRVENFLQMVRDQQTHQLPDNDTDKWRLLLAMGCGSWEVFMQTLDTHRDRVQSHFSSLFMDQVGGTDAEEDEGREVDLIWNALNSGSEDVVESLKIAGFKDPQKAQNTLLKLLHEKKIVALTEQGKKRLDQLMPQALEAVLQTDTPEIALERLIYILLAVARRTVYLALLFEQPQVLAQLVRLCAASPWFRDYIAAQPILMDGLIDTATLYSPPDKAGLAQELEDELARLDPEDEEQIIDRLRSFKKMQVFRVAAADIVGALPIMKVSDHLTWLAEVVLERVIAEAWRKMAKKYGEPTCEIDGKPHSAKIAVVGYGKLGGWEMGYSSDLDIVFLHDSAGKKQVTNGAKSIDNAVFFARLGQRIIHMLTVFTPAGELYEVDMRLRPSGNSGLLVTSLEAFERYQRKEAWIWEHQALVRARQVAGSDDIGARFRTVRDSILQEQRDRYALAQEVRQMRERMWEEQGTLKDDGFHLKKSPGGIVDIEFVVQYLVLAHAHIHSELTIWSDNIRILDTLSESGVIDEETASGLADTYRSMRDEIHRCTLNDLPVRVASKQFNSEREQVRACWQRFLIDETGE